ncbi:PREDICTED: uncharacterized protein LOC106124155 [Papilio xuthus]|uniref:Pheromone-binding protein-related protein 1 n=1 Tax=Papilio xuthus TaxID=66420 RepID=A0A194PVX5_PAPXU|nr:PREDICTED: uncharacterized protein LOC106124155 [Papilio xuthus]KPI97536.1 Pheromone-binding protein-related protein 1 [Papilio xuthus]
MLYFVVALSVLSVVALGDQSKPVIHLPPIVLNVAKEAASTCLKETGASQEVSDNFFKLKFGSDPDSKNFIYCLCRKTNYADEDGHLNEALLTLFEGNEHKDAVAKVIDTCNKHQESNKIDTMYKTVECFYKNTPVHLSV